MCCVCASVCYVLFECAHRCVWLTCLIVGHPCIVGARWCVVVLLSRFCYAFRCLCVCSNVVFVFVCLVVCVVVVVCVWTHRIYSAWAIDYLFVCLFLFFLLFACVYRYVHIYMWLCVFNGVVCLRFVKTLVCYCYCLVGGRMFDCLVILCVRFVVCLWCVWSLEFGYVVVGVVCPCVWFSFPFVVCHVLVVVR